MKKKYKKRIKLRTLLFLLITLTSNTFAWFVYNTKIENNITTSVKSWKITFINGEHDAVQYLEFKIDNIFPGMEDYNNSINISNEGETEATILYEIQEIKILEETYKSEDYTQEELNNIITNNYPFTITFNIDKTNLNAKNGNGLFSVNVKWPYESGNDELDTYWGNEAYDFHEKNKDKESIELNLVISAVQEKSE